MLAISLGLYAVSFFLPAYRMYGSWDNGPGDRGHLQMELLYGWKCFQIAWDTGKDVWYANPVFWLACGLLALRRWLGAGLAAVGAVGLGLSWWSPFSQSEFRVGYWVWLGSMAVVAGAGFYGWWGRRRAGSPGPTAPASRDASASPAAR
jgi:hypothetical protein